jgi:thiol-disulfide isomerase/thioredoxin
MKFTPVIKATLVVLMMTGVLFFSWLQYRDFLNRGRQAPDSAKILNQIEKSGLPTFELLDLDGKDISPQKFKGKVVILNFWASWCDPCVSEFPSLLKLVERFHGEVILIAVSADYERADIEHFLKMFQVKTPFLRLAWDKDLKVAKSLGTNRLPESYILSRDGQLVRKVAGVDDWSSKSAIEYFEELLKK